MELLCRLLKVSRSGYYEWLHRKPSAHEQQDQALKRQLLALHQRYPALGLDSLYHLIRRELSYSRKRIHRLMNEMGISSARKGHHKLPLLTGVLPTPWLRFLLPERVTTRYPVFHSVFRPFLLSSLPGRAHGTDPHFPGDKILL